MSRWFRHYAGMMRDEKLVRVALQSKQTVERVLWVWGAILESASEINDAGRFDLDVSETAYFLRADEADISRILECLRELGRVHENSVAKWDTRQFKSDISTARVRDHRQQGHDNKGKLRNGKTGRRNGDETELKRSSNAPETETETEKKDTRASALNLFDDWPKDYRELFWGKYPHKVGKPDALKKLDAVHKRGGVTWAEFNAGLDRYIGKNDERPWCNPATWINQQRWADQPAPAQNPANNLMRAIV